MHDSQAGIAALPRLHPGLLVARAQAADLAARLQAHAQVNRLPHAWHSSLFTLTLAGSRLVGLGHPEGAKAGSCRRI